MDTFIARRSQHRSKEVMSGDELGAIDATGGQQRIKVFAHDSQQAGHRQDDVRHARRIPGYHLGRKAIMSSPAFNQRTRPVTLNYPHVQLSTTKPFERTVG